MRLVMILMVIMRKTNTKDYRSLSQFPLRLRLAGEEEEEEEGALPA